MDKPTKFLFLYLKTGGGHLAPAKAVMDWMLESYPEKVQVNLKDGFDGAPSILKEVVEEGYSKTQTYGKWVFEFLYGLHKIKLIAWLSSYLVCKLSKPALDRIILNDTPHKIVVFHFFLIKPVNEILKKHGLKIPVITVVTDPYTAHPIWFLERNQHFVVFSKELREQLSHRRGIGASSVSVFPFTLNPNFSKPYQQEKLHEVRQMLGLKSDSKTILILGGADGIPKGMTLIRNLYNAHPNATIVMVCGRNKTLYSKALLLKTELNFSRLRVLGFVDYVRELLAIADVVITKCGASTFMEVLMSGKIPLVNSYIWEQEKGNVDFIRRNGMGLYEPNPKLLAKLAQEIIGNDEFSKTFKDNISRMHLDNGTPMVSDFIMEF